MLKNTEDRRTVSLQNHSHTGTHKQIQITDRLRRSPHFIAQRPFKAANSLLLQKYSQVFFLFVHRLSPPSLLTAFRSAHILTADKLISSALSLPTASSSIHYHFGIKQSGKIFDRETENIQNHIVKPIKSIK